MEDLTSTLDRPGGRTLGWAEYGDPDGLAVVAVHGSPDSHVFWRAAADAAREVGVRIVAPDRPGYGLSDPQPGRTVLDWVDDHDALVGHLGLERYALIAISGGSPYATAVAWARPSAVTRLGLLSVICPLAEPGVLEGTNRSVGMTFRLARRAPFLLRPLVAGMVSMARRSPERAERRLVATRPPADRAVIERPEMLALLRDNLPNQFRHAPSVALEFRLAARDWGFPLRAIEVPTTIWQGGLDDVHPSAMAQWLHQTIPGSVLDLRPEYATFNFFDEFAAILPALVVPPP